MSDEPTKPEVTPQVRFVISFVKRRMLGADQIYYHVMGISGHEPSSAVCNISRIDQTTRSYVEPAEVFGTESGGLTAAFRKAERMLTERHQGYTKFITFDFEAAS